jgi:small subunit ribosomal protein S9
MTDPVDTPDIEQTPPDMAELTFGGPDAASPEGAAAVPVAPAPVIVRGKLDRFGTAWGTGRRKTAVARVQIKSGSGKFVVNGKPMDQYFCVERDRQMIEAPLRATEKFGAVDISVNVEGGGTTGQAGAILMGISRALEAINPSLHQTLGENGFLTRDSRMVERKKYGYKKARRSFQFSKR